MINFVTDNKFLYEAINVLQTYNSFMISKTGV